MARHCACAPANHSLRVVRPSPAVNFAETHVAVFGEHSENRFIRVPRPFRMAPRCRLHWVGLVSGKLRVSVVLLMASWADCLPMIHARHPLVAIVLLHYLEGAAVTPCLSEAGEIAHKLVGWV